MKKPDLIVSFTSYPARIHVVPQVLKSLYAQTMRPSRILLWLAEEQFPNKEADLPKELLDDVNDGKFELLWCDNLGSHKKYFYAMQKYPDDVIITVDDDRVYHPDTVRALYELYLAYPTCVASLSGKLIMYDKRGKVKPYKDWLFYPNLPFPSLGLLATGGSGVLYPPHILSPNVFDKEAILNNCCYNGVICADDVWLKIHGVLMGTNTVTWGKRAFLQPQVQGLPNSAIGNLSTDEIQHEQAVRFLLKRRGINGSITAEDILAEKDWKCRNSEINPVNKYISSSYATDAFLFLINSLENRLSEANLCKNNAGHPVPVGSLLYQLQFANGIISRAGLSSYETQISKLRDVFLSIPNITLISKNSFEICVFLEHGALLLTNLGKTFGQATDYYQMLKNWIVFLDAHPEKNEEYYKRYASFLNEMKKASIEMQRRGFFLDEASQLRNTYTESWRKLPVKYRIIQTMWNTYKSTKEKVLHIISRTNH